MTPAWHAHAKRLRDEGLTHTMIARALGRSRGAVSYALTTITPPPAPRWTPYTPWPSTVVAPAKPIVEKATGWVGEA